MEITITNKRSDYFSMEKNVAFLSQIFLVFLMILIISPFWSISLFKEQTDIINYSPWEYSYNTFYNYTSHTTDPELKEWIFYPKEITFRDAKVLFDSLGIETLKNYSVLEAYRLLLTPEQVISLKEYGDIYDISNIKLKLTEVSDTSNPVLFGINDYTPLNVSNVWSLGINGSGVVIGILDTTIIYSGLLEGKRFITKVFGEGDSSNPWTYHATYVANVLVGYNSTTKKPFGVAYGAKIANAQLGVDSSGNIIGDYFAAMDWLGSIPEVSVINFSFGGFPIGNNDALTQAAEALVKKGKLVIASAGNEGSSKWYKVNSPGTSNEVICVGASVKDTSIATFSSGGPTYYFAPKPDIVAPGDNVEVAPNTYKSGTSFSAPIVSGIAALLSQYLKSNAPGIYDNSLIKASIIKSAVPITGDNRIEGEGLVNAYNALKILNESIAEKLIITAQPHNLPLPLFYDMATGSAFEQMMFVTSNQLSSINYLLEGNFSKYVSISLVEQGTLTNVYSFRFEAPTVTGIYTGKIVFFSGSKNDTISIKVSVSNNWDAIALIDLKHTVNDDLSYDLFNGENLGEFYNLLISLNVYPELFREGDLSHFNISKFTFMVMPDVFTQYSDDVMKYLPNHALTMEELSAIMNYLNNGGKLFLFFESLFNNQGTDYTELLPIMMSFDLSVAPTVMTQNSPFAAYALNCSWFSTSIRKVSHLGTYFLHAGIENVPYVSYLDQVFGYVRTTPGLGFIVTMSSNFEVDNKGLTGLYSGINNKAVIADLIEALKNKAPFYIKDIKIGSDNVVTISVISDSPVYVSVNDKVQSLTRVSNDQYTGDIFLGQDPDFLVIKNENGFVRYNLSNSFLELPTVDYQENIPVGEWAKIAILKYSKNIMPPQAVQFYLNGEKIPVYVEQDKVNPLTYVVWLNSNFTDLITIPGTYHAQLTVYNSKWEAKTFVFNIAVNNQIKTTIITSDHSFLLYHLNYALIPLFIVTIIIRLRKLKKINQ